MGAILPPTKRGRAVNGYFHSQAATCLGAAGKAGCLVRWRLGLANGTDWGTVLCIVLFVSCMTLVVLLFAWRSFFNSLCYLFAWYVAMHHMQSPIQHMCDANKNTFKKYL